MREQARKEQRRKSKQFIRSQVGDKGHLSDNDKDQTDDKPQRHENKARSKIKAAKRANKAAIEDDEFSAPAMNSSSLTKKRPSVADKFPPITDENDKKVRLYSHIRCIEWDMYDVPLRNRNISVYVYIA